MNLRSYALYWANTGSQQFNRRTGNANRNKIQTMPGGGFVKNEIKLPENWNELVAPLGY